MVWTGVLLRRLENDPQLHNVTHIIVDECALERTIRTFMSPNGADHL